MPGNEPVRCGYCAQPSERLGQHQTNDCAALKTILQPAHAKDAWSAKCVVCAQVIRHHGDKFGLLQYIVSHVRQNHSGPVVSARIEVEQEKPRHKARKGRWETAT